MEPIDYGGGDYGLAVVTLPLIPLLRAQSDRHARENAPLRARFDGRLVHLGMSRADVEQHFGEPTRTREEGEFSVCSYGRSERFNILFRVHHSPVVVAYRDGLASVVFSYDFVPMVVPGPEHEK